MSHLGLEVVRKSISECYEIFTLKALFARGPVATFARVMIGRKPTSRTATAGVFAVRKRSRRTISAAPQFSAHNVLSCTANCQLD
ncbi:MAG: hypothetical protein WCN98_13255 [Verrucomicrobiaceae bacterium]